MNNKPEIDTSEWETIQTFIKKRFPHISYATISSRIATGKMIEGKDYIFELVTKKLKKINVNYKP